MVDFGQSESDAIVLEMKPGSGVLALYVIRGNRAFLEIGPSRFLLAWTSRKVRIQRCSFICKRRSAILPLSDAILNYDTDEYVNRSLKSNVN